MSAFGPQLKAWRESRGLTAAQVAAAAGWTVPHVYRIESAARTLSEATIRRYAAAAGAVVFLSLKTAPLDVRVDKGAS